MAAKILGRYIVADNAICHGKPTFRGTRVLVSDVLDQIAEGLAWETILGDWHGLSREALAEAVEVGYSKTLSTSFAATAARSHRSRV